MLNLMREQEEEWKEKERGGVEREERAQNMEERMCQSATMVIPGFIASHILGQDRKVNGNQSKCLMHIIYYYTKGANVPKGCQHSFKAQLPPSLCNFHVRHMCVGGVFPLAPCLNLPPSLGGNYSLWSLGEDSPKLLGSPSPIIFWMSRAVDTSRYCEECEDSTRMVLSLEELAASSCMLNCLHIIICLADFSQVKCINTNRRV